MTLEKCTKSNDVRSSCVAEEKSKRYELVNKSKFRIRKVKIDGCFPQQEEHLICDYLMSIENKELKRVYFIELKGGGLTHAFNQILSSIRMFKALRLFLNYQLYARIVIVKRVPQYIGTPEYVRLARELKPKSKNEKFLVEERIRIGSNGNLSESI